MKSIQIKERGNIKSSSNKMNPEEGEVQGRNENVYVCAHVCMGNGYTTEIIYKLLQIQLVWKISCKKYSSLSKINFILGKNDRRWQNKYPCIEYKRNKLMTVKKTSPKLFMKRELLLAGLSPGWTHIIPALVLCKLHRKN